MSEYTTASGTVFTDDDVERWAGEVEQGFTGWEFDTPGPGRPRTVGQDTALPFTIRLDAPRRHKLAQLATARHVSRAQVMRDLLDHAVA